MSWRRLPRNSGHPSLACLTLLYYVRCGTGVIPVREHDQDGRATSSAFVSLLPTHPTKNHGALNNGYSNTTTGPSVANTSLIF